jgi:2-dehydropantoate 2-reductase
MVAETKQIAIVGAGPVGCAFAIHLVKAGHDVTILGRGQRLANLQKNGGVLAKKSEKATEISKTTVKAVASLDNTQPWDLIILTVTEAQCDESLLTTLQVFSKAKIMFMFNTFAALDKYYEYLGEERCIIGFPSINAAFYDGALVHQFLSSGQITLVSSHEWRVIFSSAGIKCGYESDMQSWLRTHAAIVIGIQSACVTASRRKAGISWAQAQVSADAAREGLRLVQKLGNKIMPRLIYYLGVAAPEFVLTGVMWFVTRLSFMRNNPQGGNMSRRCLDWWIA